MRRVVCPLVLLAATALPAAAQPPAAQPPGGFQPFPGRTVTKASLEQAIALFLDPAVQADLKLTADQKAALGKLADAALAKHKDALDKMAAELKEAAANREQTVAKRLAETDAAMAKHLSADQMARVKQLRYQMLGLSAFRVPEVAAALKLTAEQEKALNAAATEITRGFDTRPADGPPVATQQARADRTQAVKKAFETFVAGLSADQKAAWKQLAGEPSEAIVNMSFPTTRTALPMTLPAGVLYQTLVRSSDLQKELKLSPEQVKGVQSALNETRPLNSSASSFGVMRTVTEEVTSGAAAVLTAEQTARLTQIRRQLAGVGAFSQIEVLKAVKLTPEQAKAVEDAGAEVTRKAGPRPRSSPFSSRTDEKSDIDKQRQQLREYSAKVATLEAAAVADVVAKLDDAQRRTWDGLIGPAFDATKLATNVAESGRGTPFGVMTDGSVPPFARSLSPANAWASEARRLAATGKPAEAVAAYDEALRLKPDAVAYMTSLAWLLATCPDDTVRNGKRAVELAEKATAATKAPALLPAYLGTLAAAYAEAGRFSDAVAAQEKALAATKASGREGSPFTSPGGDQAGDDARLKLYRDGKPYRVVRD